MPQATDASEASGQDHAHYLFSELGINWDSGCGGRNRRDREFFVQVPIPPVELASVCMANGCDPLRSSARLIGLELTVRWLSANPEYPEC